MFFFQTGRVSACLPAYWPTPRWPPTWSTMMVWPGKARAMIQQVGKLREEVPGIEGEPELAELGEAFAELRIEQAMAAGSAARRCLPAAPSSHDVP